MTRLASSLSVKFADGSPCIAWTDASVRESFTDPLGSYSLTVVPPRDQLSEYRSKLQRGELIALKVDGNPLATPIIQDVVTTIGDDGVVLQVAAESVLCTPYEGSCNPELSKSWKSDVPVDQIVLEVLGEYGFSELTGDSSAHVNALTGKGVSGRAAALAISELKLRDIQASERETAYGICSRIFNRLGAALHVDWDGNLVLRRPDYSQQAAYTLVQDFDRSKPGNRILARPPIQLRQSNRGLYSEVTVRGVAPDDGEQTTAAPPIARVLSEAASRPSGAPFDRATETTLDDSEAVYESTAAPHKPLYLLDKDCRDVDRCRAVAKLAHSARAAEAHSLTCSVSGLVSREGRVWTPDTVARVTIDALGIDSDMWILERSFDVTEDGEMTSLRLLPLGALVLEA